ncbi:hypothetical protein CEP53_005961 [Fusarium sp. AF-6]|nr:hypothetical protein CEP53_005961 [Fusarium sp. AF-6]
MDPQTSNSGSNDIIVSSGASHETSSIRCRRGSLPPEGDTVPTCIVSGGRSQAEMDLELFGVGSQFDGLEIKSFDICTRSGRKVEANLDGQFPGREKKNTMGIARRLLPARRAGCKTIIFPKDNMSDWRRTASRERKEQTSFDWSRKVS